MEGGSREDIAEQELGTDLRVQLEGEGPPSRNVSASRRNFLRGGGVLVGAGLLAACTGSDGNGSAAATDTPTAGVGAPAPAQQTGPSLLDTIPESGVARLGIDLTFPPLQFRDPDTNEPTGYSVELTKQLVADLGAEPEWVEIPFAQLFAGQAAGRFDFGGLQATILPSRGLEVLFATEPAFIESVVALLRPGLTIDDLDELNDPDLTLAVQVGSSQEALAPLLFPDATLKSLENQPAIQDVASGRSDAMILSEFNIAAALDANPDLTVFGGAPAFVDYNTFFLPAGDIRFQQWVSRWLQYQTSHGVLEASWNQWGGNDARDLGLPTVPVTSPYVPTGVV